MPVLQKAIDLLEALRNTAPDRIAAVANGLRWLRATSINLQRDLSTSARRRSFFERNADELAERWIKKRHTVVVASVGTSREAAALDVLHDVYHEDVCRAVESIIDDIKEQRITSSSDLDENLNELADSHVTYTVDAFITLLCSNNDSAYLENIGSEMPSTNWHSVMASYAFRQDVCDKLERMGVDLNEPEAFEKDEEEEDD